jgi:hypothetical protein
MVTLAEKQIVPASDNTMPSSLFFIPQVLHFTNQLCWWRFDGNHGGEPQPPLLEFRRGITLRSRNFFDTRDKRLLSFNVH